MNKYISAALLGLCFAGASLTADAAVSDLPLISVKGQKCHYYDVQPRESIYQVAKKLGITREQLVQYNPSAADGLKPRMRLFFPAADFANEAGNRPAVYANAAGVTTHVVQRGETLYGIARKYGMSPDYLASLNPQAADGIRVGDTLRIVADDSEAYPAGATASASGMVSHEIKKGETLYGIANSYGIPLEALLEANPTLDPLKYQSGQTINVPTGATAADYGSSLAENTAAAPVVTPATASGVLAETIGEADADDTLAATVRNEAAEEAVEELQDAVATPVEMAEPLDVAVILPFMLSEPEMSRTTQLYTEFFRGMLMAAGEMAETDAHEAPVRFHFFDTAASADTVGALMGRPEIQEMDLIVGPDSSDQLAMIVDGVGADVPVLNIFAVKDDSYRQHRNLIQTNIPHDFMYRRAIDMFIDKYAGYTPVFISRSEGMADKETFTGELKKRLEQEGRDFSEITFHTSLSSSDLEGIDPSATPLVFVPVSGSKTEFGKFVNALTDLREKAGNPANVTVFGYPEWITFRGDNFDEICALDATIYSRFLATDSNPETRRLKERFKELYGNDMSDAVPAQGVLGYDVANFIVKGLREKEETGVFPPSFDGVQSHWQLGWSGATGTGDASDEPADNGGLVNEALYFINYHPGGVVEWTK